MNVSLLFSNGSQVLLRVSRLTYTADKLRIGSRTYSWANIVALSVH